MKSRIFLTVGCALSLALATSCENASSLNEKGNEALKAGDTAAAVGFFEKAVGKESGEAARNLGMLYAAGNGVEKSDEKAAELYTDATEWGDSIAPCLLAECYESGKGVKADAAKALELYLKSAEAGYPLADAGLAELYFRGASDLEVDWGKAFSYSEKAAATGDADALGIYGFFVGTGRYGAAKDAAKGEELMRKAVENGSVLAKGLLGYYIMGYTSKASSEGVKLVNEAAEAGDLYGLAFSGLPYEYGAVRGGFSKASKVYEEAANKGCAWAMFRNATVLIDLMNKRDTGHEWLRKAAAAGDGDALSRLGYSYLNGYGEEESPEKAYNYFLKGAEKGNGDAMSNLAWCYENGSFVEKDKQKAIEWYEKAVKYGDNGYSAQRLKALK